MAAPPTRGDGANNSLSRPPQRGLPPSFSVIVIALATVGLLGACTASGAAVCRVAGLAGPRGCLPAVGLAALMTVASPAARLPGGADVALVVVLGVSLGALVWRPVRRAFVALSVDGVIVSVAALGLIVLPWLAAGHGGLLGMGVNNDTPTHLVAVRWLVDRAVPVADTLVGAGYPLGPHALAAALSPLGVPLESGLTAVSMLAPIAVALAMLDGLASVPRAARCGLALVAGLSYLFVSYYAQMAFKETIEALLLVAFVLVLPAVARAASSGRRSAARAAVVPAVLLAGTVHTMSWAGLLWPLASLGVWWLLEARARRRSPRALLAGAGPALWSGAVALLLVISAELPRIVAFQGSRYAHEPDHGQGNLEGTLPPYKALGVWLGPDFRFGTALPVLVAVALAGAAVLCLVGVRTWLRRGERVPVAALAGSWVLWAALDLTKNGYDAAKGLPIVAPLVGLAMVTGAVATWRHAGVGRGDGPAAAPDAPVPPLFAAMSLPGRRPSLRRGAVAAVLVLSSVSSAWALRDAVVGVDAHARELRGLAASAPPGPMLVLDNSDWAAWDLYGVEIWRPPLLYGVHTVPIRGEKAWRGGEPFDLDAVSSDTLNQFATVLTARNAVGSAPPRGLRVLRRTASFVLWQRVGTVPPRGTLAEGWLPGAVLDCSTPAGAQISRRRGWALVRPRPVVATAPGWSGGARQPGTVASRMLRLGAGRWDLALQYVSRNPLEVQAGSLHLTLPANLDRLGPLFALGSVDGGGTVPVRVRVVDPPGIGWMLGAPLRTRALDSWDHQPLGALVATRHGTPPQRVPLARACGRYVDSYTLG
jgi:hypothetical protein